MVNVNEVPEFYQGYIKILGEGELVPLLLKTGDEFITFCRRISEPQGNYRYAAGKWSIKEIIQHVIDCERVFAYRALVFARNDQTELAGLDQDHYVDMSNADERPVHNLVTEFTNVRAATVDLFSSFNHEVKARRGTANGVAMTVEMIGYIISGHLKHHLDIIYQRYTQ